MKIILSAFYCHPNKGSEAGVGWNWLKQLSKNNEVHCFFSSEEGQEDAVKKAVMELEQWENIHLYPVKIPYIYQKLHYRIKYEIWQKLVFNTAKVIVKKEKIDLIHHVSIAAWWNCGFLWRLPVPFVFGPILGAQVPNLKTIKYLPKKSKLYEILRIILFNVLWLIWRRPHKAIKKAALVFCGNSATYERVSKKRKGLPTILFSATGIDTNNNNALFKSKMRKDNKLKLLWVGRILPIKNLNLLFNSLEILPEKLNWELTIIGDGNYLKDLKQKTKDNTQIKYLGKVDYSQIDQHYKASDIFVFPSIREGSPTAVLEAMANGLPVIGLDITGVRDIVDENCGILVPLNEPGRMIKDFSEAIARLDSECSYRKKLGENAKAKIEKNFNWEIRGKQMLKYYRKYIKEESI